MTVPRVAVVEAVAGSTPRFVEAAPLADPTLPFASAWDGRPESAARIVSRGALETVQSARCFVKRLDAVAAVGAEVVLDVFDGGADPYRFGSAWRPVGLVLLEISRSVGHRWVLEARTAIEGGVRLRFRKVESAFSPGDSIGRWTFGVIYNGENEAALRTLYDDVAALGIPEWEFLVCGPVPAGCEGMRQVAFTPRPDIRAQTPAKKNRLVSAAQFDNLVLLHNRFRFPAGWYRRFAAGGNVFEVVAVPIELDGAPGTRVLDWIRAASSRSHFSLDTSDLLPYDEWSPDVYVDGGMIIAKRAVLAAAPYDERLHWGEGEDLALSEALWYSGALIELRRDAPVRTTTIRHRASQPLPGPAPARMAVRRSVRAIRRAAQRISAAERWQAWLGRAPGSDDLYRPGG